MYLDFKNNYEALTLGVEMELQILDRKTLQLTPKAPEILEMTNHGNLVKEMFRSTLEVVTKVCRDVHEVNIDLQSLLLHVHEAAEKLDLRYAGTGTHPTANYNERILSAANRYHLLLDRNQWLIRRMAVYGLHVHIGMRNGDACIRFNNFFLHFIPHLIALSASSPYWRGHDTGLAASRPTVYEAHPTSGIPYPVKDWSQFNELYNTLLRTKSIEGVKDIWWDIRPSPGYGTLEIRICDGPATMLELLSLVAWIHLLSHWFNDHGDAFFEQNVVIPQQWILRENKWRAIRYGLQAEIISHESLEIKKLSESIYYWIDILEPYSEKLGYQKYMNCIKDLIQKGNSSHRQREFMQGNTDLQKLIEYNTHEFERGEPLWMN